ncbi:MAG: precorrin-3B synthase, partial [Hyphomicrobium sp.]
ETALASYALPLPGKFGFAVDCGSERVLHSVPADIRIERSADGKLIVRPDGSAYGLHIEPSEAATAAMALAHWFIQSGGVKHGRGRMAAHIASGVALPASLCGSALPVEAAPVAFPGLVRGGALAGLAFGSMHAGTLDQIARHGQELRLTPWRMIFLPSVSTMPVLQDVIVDGRDPLLRVQACTGSPSCPQGRAETRRLARKLARHLPDAASLHVSGCPKGCACARPATVTLVATPDGFDYIRNGTAADKAMLTGISAADLEKHSAYYLAGHA